MQLANFGELTFSKLRFYSVGIVAENKLLGSKQIEVVPIEDTPFVDGEITAKLDANTASAADTSGASYVAAASSSVSLNATWLSLSVSNRLSAPDVRRGEYVMIYQFSDADKYYWTTLKEDNALRRLETVIWGFSGSQTENSAVTPETMYYFEISTHRKSITLHTSKADGEPYAYDIQLNTKDGSLVIQDDIGNYVHLDSAQRRIELKNADGSHYDMLQENLTVTIPNTTKFVTKDFLVQASNTCNIKATNTFHVETTSSSIDGSSYASMTSQNATVTGSASVTMAGDSFKVAGGAIDIAGGASISIVSPSTSIV